MRHSVVLASVLIAAVGLVLPAVAGQYAAPTVQPVGSTLPNGRALTPAGAMVAAGDFPAGGLLTTGGRFLAATTGSQANVVLDADPASLVLNQTTPNGAVSSSTAPWALNGHLAVGPDNTVYATAGKLGAVDVFSQVGPTLRQSGTVATGGYAAGLALAPDGAALLVTRPFDRAVSGGERKDLGEFLRWFHEPQGGSRSVVQAVLNGQDVSGAV